MIANNFMPLFSMPGGGEMIWLVIGILILFGGKKLPELARGLGKGIRDFKEAKEGVKSEVEAGMQEERAAVK
jgi:sec-independent protein translocase protein TatA